MTVVDKNQKHDNNKYIWADTVKTLTRPAQVHIAQPENMDTTF